MKIADIRNKAAEFLKEHFKSARNKGSFMNRLVNVITPSKPISRAAQTNSFAISMAERSVSIPRFSTVVESVFDMADSSAQDDSIKENSSIIDPFIDNELECTMIPLKTLTKAG